MEFLIAALGAVTLLASIIPALHSGQVPAPVQRPRGSIRSVQDMRTGETLTYSVQVVARERGKIRSVTVL